MNEKPDESRPRLIHPDLHKIPQAVRFQISGAANTVLFMTFLTIGSHVLKDHFAAATIYSLCSLIFIPIGHATTSLITFGWPKEYLQNLLMNVPIGIMSTTIGSIATGVLTSIEFDVKVTYLLQKLSLVEEFEATEEDATGYTNVAVIIITGIFSFIVSTIVNSPKSQKSEKDL